MFDSREAFCSVKAELQNSLSGQAVVGDGSLNFCCILLGRDVFLLSWIDVAHDCHTSIMLASDQVDAASLTCYRKDRKASPYCSSERCETSVMGIWFDSAKRFSEDLVIIYLEFFRAVLITLSKPSVWVFLFCNFFFDYYHAEMRSDSRFFSLVYISSLFHENYRSLLALKKFFF